MIGNDIIDLKATREESNWSRPRLISKLFTKREQAFIECSATPEIMLWQLWSMKESAYKVWIQHGERRFFGPKKICCQGVSNENTAVVSIGHWIFYTQSFLSNDYIYTLAYSREECTRAKAVSQTFSIGKIDNQQISGTVYNRLMTSYASNTSIVLTDLDLQKTATGVPFLSNKGSRLEVSISLTHHGNYGAFAWLML